MTTFIKIDKYAEITNLVEINEKLKYTKMEKEKFCLYWIV